MAILHSSISAVLLFWHAVWTGVFGDAGGLGTNWSWVLGIVFLVLTVRALLFPVVVRQVKSQRAMQALQPQLKGLQPREVAELYRAAKVNPLMSIVPLLLQIPVLVSLLHVLRHLRPSITSETSRTLYGWTLAQFDSAAHAELFGAPIAATFNSPGGTVKLVAAALIAVMVVTTYITSRQMIRRAGWAEEPQARMVQRLMLYGVPLSLLISGVLFPIGVVLYWMTQSLFALGQQTWILHRYPPPDPRSPTAVPPAS